MSARREEVDRGAWAPRAESVVEVLPQSPLPPVWFAISLLLGPVVFKTNTIQFRMT